MDVFENFMGGGSDVTNDYMGRSLNVRECSSINAIFDVTNRYPPAVLEISLAK